MELLSNAVKVTVAFLLTSGINGQNLQDRENVPDTESARGFLLNAILTKLKLCECGRANAFPVSGVNQRIVGGRETQPHAYPWMAILTGNGTFLCGGSVISDRYVLTAGHCLNGRYRQDQLRVILGEHDRCTTDFRERVYSVQRVLRHPAFNLQDYRADIMLLRLNRRIAFNENIRPICLPPYAQRPVDQRLVGRLGTVLGWGRTSSINPPSCRLREVMVPILSRERCEQAQLSDQNTPPGERGLFCAGLPGSGRDACQGDSGGPLQLTDTFRRTYITGIVSNGLGCGIYPGLYTDVSRFIPWITRNTADSFYCVP